MKTLKVGKRGTVVIPASLRRKYGLREGALVILEERQGGLFLRPAVTFPVEIYTPERKAEFLLNNAVTPEEYRRAAEEVRRMGLDPEDYLRSPDIQQHRPG